MKNSYREKVLAPIAGQHFVGELLSDDDDFEFVSSQMMKIGSLAHNEILWHEVEEKTLDLLAYKTKDVRLIGYLLQCLHHKTTPERFLLSLHVLTDFMQAYWIDCHPNAAKARFFVQIMQRTEKVMRTLSSEQRAAMSRENMMNAFSDLLAVAKSKELPTDLVETVMSCWAIKHVETEKHVKQVQMATAEPIQTDEKVPEINLYATEEKEKKESLLKVVDYLWQTTEEKSLACRLRRHVIWGSISSLPDKDAKGETLLFAMSSDRVADYQGELEHSPSLELWKRIENSLTLSPFWLDGHYLSFQLAKKLNQPHSARAIKEEAQTFVSRLVGVKNCKFQGGTPYISEATQQWLKEETTDASVSQVTTAWEQERENALARMEQEGLSAALEMLNDGLIRAKEPRERFYWRLLSAELMDKQALSALAKQEYHTLLKQTENIRLQDWEPSLLHRLKQLANAE